MFTNQNKKTIFHYFSLSHKLLLFMGQKFFSKINNNALSCILSAYLENETPTECGKFQNILLSMEFQNLPTPLVHGGK